MNENQIITYPAPRCVNASPWYAVAVNEIPSFVYGGEFSGFGDQPGVDQSELMDTYAKGGYSFTIFSFQAGKIVIRIQTAVEIHSIVVRPLSQNIVPRQTSPKRILLELDRPAKLSVEFNGDIGKPLFIFADEMETDVPDQDDPEVLFFGPGMHNISKDYVIPQGKHKIYLAGGAYVKGNFVDSRKLNLRPFGMAKDSLTQEELEYFLKGFNNVNLLPDEISRLAGITSGTEPINEELPDDVGILGAGSAVSVDRKDRRIKIYGRGILSGEDMPLVGHLGITNGIRLDHSDGVTIEGITILNSAGWQINCATADPEMTRPNLFRNLKLIGWRSNTDGIHPGNVALVEDCFLMVNDDAFNIGQFTTNIKVKNCVVWSTWGSIALLSWFSSYGGNAFINQIDIIHWDVPSSYHYGPILLVHDGTGDISNVIIQNLHFEDVRFCKTLIRMRIEPNPFALVKGVPGSVWNITIRDVEFPNETGENTIYGRTDTGSYIKNVRYENLKVHGNLITAAGQIDLNVGPYAEGVEFVLSEALRGDMIGTESSYENNRDTTLLAALDGRLSSYFKSAQADGTWVGLDFGQGNQKKIVKLAYAPRAGYANLMLGGRFQGSNQADFKDAEDLYVISALPAEGRLNSVPVKNSNRFRFVRFLSPDGSYGNIAEVDFFGK
jgi:hypothetical protein